MSTTDEQIQAQAVKMFEEELAALQAVSRQESVHMSYRIPLRAVLEAFIPAAALEAFDGWKVDAFSTYSREEMSDDEREDVLEIAFVRTLTFKPDDSGLLVPTPKSRANHCVTRAQAEKMIEEKVSLVFSERARGPV